MLVSDWLKGLWLTSNLAHALQTTEIPLLSAVANIQVIQADITRRGNYPAQLPQMPTRPTCSPPSTIIFQVIAAARKSNQAARTLVRHNHSPTPIATFCYRLWLHNTVFHFPLHKHCRVQLPSARNAGDCSFGFLVFVSFSFGKSMSIDHPLGLLWERDYSGAPVV